MVINEGPLTAKVFNRKVHIYREGKVWLVFDWSSEPTDKDIRTYLKVINERKPKQ